MFAQAAVPEIGQHQQSSIDATRVTAKAVAAAAAVAVATNVAAAVAAPVPAAAAAAVATEPAQAKATAKEAGLAHAAARQASQLRQVKASIVHSTLSPLRRACHHHHSTRASKGPKECHTNHGAVPP